jgi:hypothetical protein
MKNYHTHILFFQKKLASYHLDSYIIFNSPKGVYNDQVF